MRHVGYLEDAAAVLILSRGNKTNELGLFGLFK